MKHCPECNAEYVESADRCSDCDVELLPGPVVKESEPEESHPDVALERVYAAGDPVRVALARSLLDDAHIQYMAKGDGIQDLFGWGRFGAGLNYVVGPVEFFVASDDAGAAREILAQLDEPRSEEGEAAG